MQDASVIVQNEKEAGGHLARAKTETVGLTVAIFNPAEFP
jgi:hypothetical protein